MTDALDVFISYSHDDEEHLQELLKHLAVTERRGLFRIWHDQEIGAGEEWRRRIEEKLEAADVILLLVSSSFIASDDYWNVETRRALEHHGKARVIPVIVRPCDWRDARFAELQALPKDGKAITTWENRDEAWLDVVRGLRQVLEGLGATLPLFQRSLQLREKVLGEDHPHFAASLNNLAVLHRAQREYDQALSLIQRSLKISEKVLGKDHPDVAQSLENFAALLRDMEPTEERETQIAEMEARAKAIRAKQH